MARAASLTQQWLIDTGRVVSSTVAIRFCGATPDSSDIRRLLVSLSHQITYATQGYRHRIPHDYKRVKRHFRALVQVVPLFNYNLMITLFRNLIHIVEQYLKA